MTEQNTTLTTRPSALDIYGAGDDIKTLADRIKLCLPGGEKLQRHEALALAQLAVAYGLNPFNGEVWYIPGKGTQVGIKGLRKTAKRQAAYWIEHVLLTPEERKANGVPDNAIAYKCLVYRTDMIRESAAACKAFREAGMEDAVDRYAYKPTVGIGYWTVGESTKMKGDQAARKRAEADALKQAFDLPFASEVGNGNTIGYVDSEWREVTVEDRGPRWDTEDEPRGTWSDPAPAPVPTPPPQPERILNPNTGRPLTAEAVRTAIRRKAGWNGHRLLDGEPITEKQVPTVAMLIAGATRADGMTQADMDKARHDILTYLFAVDSTGKLTKREASALIDWLTIKDGLELNEYARAEAAGILRAVLVEQGQAELGL